MTIKMLGVDMPKMRVQVAHLIEHAPQENKIEAICEIIKMAYELGYERGANKDLKLVRLERDVVEAAMAEFPEISTASPRRLRILASDDMSVPVKHPIHRQAICACLELARRKAIEKGGKP